MHSRTTSLHGRRRYAEGGDTPAVVVEWVDDFLRLLFRNNKNWRFILIPSTRFTLSTQSLGPHCQWTALITGSSILH